MNLTGFTNASRIDAGEMLEIAFESTPVSLNRGTP